MRSPVRHLHQPLPDGTYVELVASLAATRLPAAIMTVLFVLVGTFADARANDPFLTATLVAGVLASAVRLAILFDGRRRCDAGAMTLAEARRFERAFAASYIAFAAIFGGFAARALALPLMQLHMPVGVLVVGYAAGVVATTALRPRIAVASLLLAVVPSIATLLCDGTAHAITALCFAALTAGGLRSLGQRYGSQAIKTTTRQASALLARQDHLTGLANRLALAETFERLAQAGAGAPRVAVHYLDLDDFKPVNDRLGHLVGDALLRAVAARLQGEQRPGDVAARLGGDEFAFVQVGVTSSVDVAEKAARLESVLGMPYRIDERSVIVGASVGSSGEASPTLGMDAFLQQADEALRARKVQRKVEADPRPTANGERLMRLV